MKIIKRGALPEKELFRGTCHSCKTVFECERSEGTYTHASPRDGAFLSVDCPVCGYRATAYTRKDDQLIPSHRRSDLSWQMEHSETQQERLGS